MCLPEAWYNKGCIHIHLLANPCNGCASIVISIGRGVGSAIAHRRQKVWYLRLRCLHLSLHKLVFKTIGTIICKHFLSTVNLLVLIGNFAVYWNHIHITRQSRIAHFALTLDVLMHRLPLQSLCYYYDWILCMPHYKYSTVCTWFFAGLWDNTMVHSRVRCKW